MSSVAALIALSQVLDGSTGFLTTAFPKDQSSTLAASCESAGKGILPLPMQRIHNHGQARSCSLGLPPGVVFPNADLPL
jgi:hypothetical protein